MKGNKYINREGQTATKIFDSRSLEVDYRTLKPILKRGMTVLDIGCGTGSISKDIAMIIGSSVENSVENSIEESGQVIGIDNTQKFIESGQESYQDIPNLKLIHTDLFEFETTLKFDLIISARTLQWLSNPKSALQKMITLLKPNGTISILDYNHNKLEWNPEPPQSMKAFYETFLKWRSDAGMNNGIADDLPSLMKKIGLVDIKKFNSDEYYDRKRTDFISKVGIWSKVAGSTQMVDEGYLENELRLKAIEDYNTWVENEAVSMTMKLNEVRGRLNE